jgi:hypothetical protein
MGVNAPPTFMWHDKTSGRLYASTAEVEFKEVQLKTGMKYRIASFVAMLVDVYEIVISVSPFYS